MVREAFDDIKEGVKIDANWLNKLGSHDKCVIASTEKGLQRLT